VIRSAPPLPSTITFLSNPARSSASVLASIAPVLASRTQSPPSAAAPVSSVDAAASAPVKAASRSRNAESAPTLQP